MISAVNCPGNRVRYKLNPTGSALVYSTYLGGTGDDVANALAIDGSGNAYVAGQTHSTNFPTTAGAFQTTSPPSYGPPALAFVTKVNPTGSALVYSTYLGGVPGDARALAIDGSGNAYVAGITGSSKFPTTPGAFQTVRQGTYNAFVTKLNPSGSALVYSTYLGGERLDEVYALAIDGSGNAYVAGKTSSTTFPTTAGAFQTTYHAGTILGGDAFVTKVNPTGTALVYSTYLGGTGDEIAYALAVDGSGNAYVAGSTSSTNFPTTAGTFQTGYQGAGDAFLTKLNPTGSALVYSTYLGGTGQDGAAALAVDGSGNAYVAGSTYSSNFPTTAGAFQGTFQGPMFRYTTDAFVAKIAAGTSPPGTFVVVSTDPPNNGTGVPTTSTLSVVFNTAADAFTLNPLTVRLTVLSSSRVVPTWPLYDAATNTLTISPASPLNSGETYQLLLPSSIRSLSGVSLSSYSLEFTTTLSSQTLRVADKLEEYRRAARAALDGNENQLAYYVAQSVAAMQEKATIDLAAIVADKIGKIITTGSSAAEIKLFGPGTTGIDKGFRHFIELYRLVDKVGTSLDAARDVWVISNSNAFLLYKVRGRNDEILSDLLYLNPKTEQNVEEYLDSKYVFIDLNQPLSDFKEAYTSITGMNDVKAALDAAIEGVKTTLPASLTETTATRVVALLDRQIASLELAQKQEVNASAYTRLFKLGSLFSWSDSFEQGRKYYSLQEYVFRGLHVAVNSVGYAIKGGGLATIVVGGIGLGPVALGDLMLIGNFLADKLIVSTIEENVHILPQNLLQAALVESWAGLNEEVQTQLAFHDTNLAWVMDEVTLPSAVKLARSALDVTEMLKISSVRLNAINLDGSGVGTCEVDIQNAGTSPLLVTVWANVLSPGRDRQARETVAMFGKADLPIGAGVATTLQLKFTAPRSADISSKGLEVMVGARGVDASTGLCYDAHPFSARLVAGTSGQLTALAGVSSEKVLAGMVRVSDRQEASIEVFGGASNVTWNLGTNQASSANLHLYDSFGRHVGLDYGAVTEDAEIPGCSYSGPTGAGEFIACVSPAAGTYRVTVVGVTAEVMLSLAETGGVSGLSGISVRVSDLLASAGGVIPASRIAVTSLSPNLAKETAQEVTLSVGTSGVCPGIYRGTITVSASNGSDTVSENTLLELRLQDPAYPTPVIIQTAGSNPSCPGTSIALDAGAGYTSYSWSTGATTRTIAVSPLTTTTYTVTGTSGGCASAAANWTQTVIPVPSTPVITAPAAVGAGSPNRVASVASHAGSLYAWSVTNGTITSGQGTNQISFTAGVAGTPLTLSVTETNASGCVSAPGNATVTVAAGASALLFYTVTPCRQIDTRSGSPLASGGTLTVPLTGAPCGLPSGASAVSVNLTVTQQTAPGHVTIYPSDQGQPLISNINFKVEASRANNAILGLSSDGTGRVNVFNGSGGTVHVILDVNGYFQ